MELNKAKTNEKTVLKILFQKDKENKIIFEIEKEYFETIKILVPSS